jgi:hypothetical protein
MAHTNVQFVSGNLTTGGNDPTFYIDRVNNKVGIGEVPETSGDDSSNVLQVNGSVLATKYHGDGSSLTGIENSQWLHNISDSTKIYYNGGNVGIGEDNPGSKLVVNGDIDIKNGNLKTNGTDAIFSNWETDTNGINRTGNVGIGGDASATNSLKVHGTVEATGALVQNGKEIYAQRRWEIDLTAQTNTRFYPIEFKHPVLEGTPDLPDMYPVHFKVFGESLGGNDPYNENTLVGYARASGWTDHEPMYDVHIKRYSGGETRFQGLYEGTGSYVIGFVIYMRGGYRYSALTDASEVVTHTSVFTYGTSTFALKNSNGGDVSGTSAAISQLVDIGGSTQRGQRWMSDNLYVTGDIYATGDVTASSDRRLKTDIKRIEGALNKVRTLGGYTFTKNDNPSTGLIAQEVLEVLPEAVHGTEETYYSIAYGNMVGILIEAIKELSDEVKELKEKIG